MLKTRAIGVLCLAALLGAVAVFLARDWIESQVPAPVVITEDRVPLTKVVVAGRDLFLGDRLEAGNLEEREWPAHAVPAGAFKDMAKLTGEDRFVLRAIMKNAPVLASKITGEGGRASLSAVISADKRAVTVRVNDVRGVAGFVLPGDYVDVLLTQQKRTDQPTTRILLQKIKVLGVDQDANQHADKARLVRAVTLEVSPEQAQKLALAPDIGTMSLALRNTINASTTPSRVIGLADLGAGDASEMASIPAGALPTRVVRRDDSDDDSTTSVTVIRGLESVDYRVRQSEAGNKVAPKMMAADEGGLRPESRIARPLVRRLTTMPRYVGTLRPIDLISVFALSPNAGPEIAAPDANGEKAAP